MLDRDFLDGCFDARARAERVAVERVTRDVEVDRRGDGRTTARCEPADRERDARGGQDECRAHSARRRVLELR